VSHETSGLRTNKTHWLPTGSIPILLVSIQSSFGPSILTLSPLPVSQGNRWVCNRGEYAKEECFQCPTELDYLRLEGMALSEGSWHMTSLTNLLNETWQYKISLAPVLLTFLIFEAPALVRRWFRWFYTPVYFIFFPLGHSDQLYAQYFNEDDHYLVGASQTEDEKRALRSKIIAISIVSMIFSTAIAPSVAGFISVSRSVQRISVVSNIHEDNDNPVLIGQASECVVHL
jgi:hypothetical protein